MAIVEVGLEKYARASSEDFTLRLKWTDGGEDLTLYDDRNLVVLKAIEKAKSAGLETVQVSLRVLEDLIRTSV